MLEKARKLMQQREAMIVEAKETLVVLGAEEMETTMVNQIVINKGKVVEVPVVKEVVVDNTDTATIEMLRETIRQMNETMNDMNKEIAELKEELSHKDLLLDEFREAMDEKVTTIHELEDKIDGMEYVHRGVVAGYEAQLTNKDIKIESLEKQIADVKEDKVRAEIIKTKSGATIEVVDDPLYNEPVEEKPVVNNKPVNNKISLTYTSLQVTHDAIKAVAHDKANNVKFYFVWTAATEKLPSYSVSGARGTWSRMNGTGMYQYGKQIVEDFKELAAEKLIKRTKDGKVKTTTKVNKPNKPADKPVVKETKEVVVETNDDPLGNTDDMEFDFE